MYSFESRVRYSEVGQNRLLKTDALINYFQDCSTFQSEDLGVGLTVLSQRKRCWIINSWQVKVHRYPALGEKIHISTKPNTLQGIFGTRNFLMEDASGEVLAVATSLWTYFDVEHLKPAKIENDILSAYTLEESFEEDWEGRKIALMPEMELQEPFFVQRSHLDTNNHVNNGQYITMAMGYLPQEGIINRFRVEYKKAAVYGNEIFPYVYKKDGVCLIKLADKSGAPYAVVEFRTNLD